MLVLSRKEDDKIIIDENIIITVVELHGGRVKVGIDAPANIEIHREEIYHKIEMENREAGNNGGMVKKLILKGGD
ncbi:carbon storage regulator CsrA [Halocella sp. SP3-1]|uniref:carbon storage regulator CsrA n=1 Tax=Halocella sp. SP3-1 TaxID=2382161 RepID=UPI000F74DCD9|nr:carbon storage regulator CsrA [Halocella sp. SP3-1]AZO95886.1 carbon storage regulator [Halocella sp. SP3-1]